MFHPKKPKQRLTVVPVLHPRISGRTCTQRNEPQHSTTQHHTTQRQKRNEDCPGFLNSTGRLNEVGLLPHPCLLGGTQEAGNAMSPLHSWGSPNKGGQNQKWLPHPCLLGGPKEGGNAMSPLHSWGSPNKGGQNQKWLPQPCLLGGPKEGGNVAFSGILKQKGTKSEVAASPLPSRGPKRGRKCYVTPTFSGDPPTKGIKSQVKTYARGNNDNKYGSLVRPHAQIVALR